jgi:hypothetical protein
MCRQEKKPETRFEARKRESTTMVARWKSNYDSKASIEYRLLAVTWSNFVPHLNGGEFPCRGEEGKGKRLEMKSMELSREAS